MLTTLRRQSQFPQPSGLIVNFYLIGFARRQLAALGSMRKKQNLVNLIENSGGPPIAGWYPISDF